MRRPRDGANEPASEPSAQRVREAPTERERGRAVSERRGGLGRGLAALIPTGPPVEPAPPPPPPPAPVRPAPPADPTAILFGGPRPAPRAVAEVSRETPARSAY